MLRNNEDLQAIKIPFTDSINQVLLKRELKRYKLKTFEDCYQYSLAEAEQGDYPKLSNELKYSSGVNFLFEVLQIKELLLWKIRTAMFVLRHNGGGSLYYLVDIEISKNREVTITYWLNTGFFVHRDCFDVGNIMPMPLPVNGEYRLDLTYYDKANNLTLPSENWRIKKIKKKKK